MYTLYTVLLNKHILPRIDAYFTFYYIFYTHITHKPIKFLAPLPETKKSLVLHQKRYQVFGTIKFLVPLSGKLHWFMLISIPSASLALQTFFFI